MILNQIKFPNNMRQMSDESQDSNYAYESTRSGGKEKT